MIEVPVSTVERPLTAIDFCAALQTQCHTIEDIREFSAKVPLEVLNDERYNRAVAMRLAAIRDRKAAA